MKSISTVLKIVYKIKFERNENDLVSNHKVSQGSLIPLVSRLGQLIMYITNKMFTDLCRSAKFCQHKILNPYKNAFLLHSQT